MVEHRSPRKETGRIGHGIRRRTVSGAAWTPTAVAVRTKRGSNARHGRQPERLDARRHVAVAFRQCPGFLLIEGGVAEFLRLLVREKRFARGRPAADPRWEPLPDSPLV